MIAGFASFVIVRFAVFSGGAVEQKSLLPDPGLFLTYIGIFGEYLKTPFVAPAGDPWSWLWGLLPAASAVLLATKYGNVNAGDKLPRSRFTDSPLYAMGLGLATFALGVFPYLLAGYDAVIGFTSQSRVYSSASYGFALFLAALATAPRKPALRTAAHLLASGVYSIPSGLFCRSSY